MSEPVSRRVRDDLPFRRIALVLSGGGAFGAYEVGVLRALETAGIRPAIVAGVSIGAINAVLWMAHGFRTRALEEVWSRLRPSSVGMRWITLLVRTGGSLLMAIAALQLLLTLAGSPQLSPRRLLVPVGAGENELAATLLDALAWLLVGVVGLVVIRGSRSAEEWFDRLSPSRDPHRLQRWFGWLLAAGVAVHLGAWWAGVAWPHRFSASVLMVGGLLWFASRAGRSGDRLRALFLRVLPEAGGRGIWGSDPRRRLIRRAMAGGDPAALTTPGTHLIITACAIGSGEMCYFVNWADPTPEFRARIAQSVGQVVPLRTPDEIVEAAVASSAVPPVFEPVRIGDREFVDGGVFGNQPLRAVMADGADAVLIALVSPSQAPPAPSNEPHLIGLAGRLLEIANWRNLQTEMRALPAGWSTVAGPRGEAARICVFEPDGPLPGGFYGIPRVPTVDLMERGVRDAWRALEAAGWLAPPSPDMAAAAPEDAVSAGSGATPSA